MYKLRSMVKDAEEMLRADKKMLERYVNGSYKLEDDPRVTVERPLHVGLSLWPVRQLLQGLLGCYLFGEFHVGGQVLGRPAGGLNLVTASVVERASVLSGPIWLGEYPHASTPRAGTRSAEAPDYRVHFDTSATEPSSSPDCLLRGTPRVLLSGWLVLA